MSDVFFADRVRETSVDTGTGPLALVGAVPGFRRFADAAGPGARFHYAIQGVTQRGEWETGTGEIDADGRLVREALLSPAGSAPADFSAGLKTVALVAGAAWFETVEAMRTGGVAAISGLQDALDAKADAEQPIEKAYSAADDRLLARSVGDAPASVPASAFVRRGEGGHYSCSGRLGIGVDAPSRELSIHAADLPTIALVKTNIIGWYLGNQDQSNSNDFTIGYNSVSVLRLTTGLEVLPGSDATANLGSAGARFAQLFVASGAISTSDARDKEAIGDMPDAWLDAWGDVRWRRFRYSQGTRWHIGLVAQDVRDAFAVHGIDGCAIGLLCRDDTGQGERWGLRYDECQAIEAAWQRREIARLSQRIDAIESPT